MRLERQIEAQAVCAGGIPAFCNDAQPAGDFPAVTAHVHVDDDLVLVHSSQAGDHKAFEELVRRHERRMFGFALNMLHNPEDAEEAVQEVFLKVFRNLSRFRETAKFSSWLFRITVNECLCKLRGRRKPQPVSLEGDIHAGGETLPMEIADWGPNPEERYRSEELCEILARCLQSLSPASVAVFRLRDVEGLSTEETAGILDISISSVKTRLFRARLQLRDKLNHHFGHARPSSKPHGS